MIVVAVVMSIYSMFLVHLNQSFRPGLDAEVLEVRDYLHTAAEQVKADKASTTSLLQALDTLLHVFIVRRIGVPVQNK